MEGALFSEVMRMKDQIKDLQIASDLNTKTLMGRLEVLEAAAEQARTDKEQAQRKDLADLRKRAESAEAEAKRLRDAAATEAAATAVTGKK